MARMAFFKGNKIKNTAFSDILQKFYKAFVELFIVMDTELKSRTEKTEREK